VFAFLDFFHKILHHSCTQKQAEGADVADKANVQWLLISTRRRVDATQIPRPPKICRKHICLHVFLILFLLRVFHLSYVSIKTACYAAWIPA